MRKALGSGYDKWNISVVICDISLYITGGFGEVNILGYNRK
jgi:hypothetical protein